MVLSALLKILIITASIPDARSRQAASGIRVLATAAVMRSNSETIRNSWTKSNSRGIDAQINAHRTVVWPSAPGSNSAKTFAI